MKYLLLFCLLFMLSSIQPLLASSLPVRPPLAWALPIRPPLVSSLPVCPPLAWIEDPKKTPGNSNPGVWMFIFWFFYLWAIICFLDHITDSRDTPSPKTLPRWDCNRGFLSLTSVLMFSFDLINVTILLK